VGGEGIAEKWKNGISHGREVGRIRGGVFELTDRLRERSERKRDEWDIPLKGGTAEGTQNIGRCSRRDRSRSGKNTIERGKPGQE